MRGCRSGVVAWPGRGGLELGLARFSLTRLGSARQIAVDSARLGSRCLGLYQPRVGSASAGAVGLGLAVAWPRLTLPAGKACGPAACRGSGHAAGPAGRGGRRAEHGREAAPRRRAGGGGRLGWPPRLAGAAQPRPAGCSGWPPRALRERTRPGRPPDTRACGGRSDGPAARRGRKGWWRRGEGSALRRGRKSRRKTDRFLGEARSATR